MSRYEHASCNDFYPLRFFYEKMSHNPNHSILIREGFNCIWSCIVSHSLCRTQELEGDDDFKYYNNITL